MAWFRNDRRAVDESLIVPSLTPEELERIGIAAYGGATPLGAMPSLVDPMVLEVLQGGGFPRSGTDEHTRLTDQFLGALESAAARASDWGNVGAFIVADNFLDVGQEEHPTYLRLALAGLRSLKTAEVPMSAMPPYMHKLWNRLNLEQQ